MRWHRRKNYSGNPMLVNLPIKGYKDTGEGGLAFFLVVEAKGEDQRCACIIGGAAWREQDTSIRPTRFRHNTKIDASLLIGSTGLSLYSDEKESYFYAKSSDLTSRGKQLYQLLKSLYGKVSIVTLLDT